MAVRFTAIRSVSSQDCGAPVRRRFSSFETSRSVRHLEGFPMMQYYTALQPPKEFSVSRPPYNALSDLLGLRDSHLTTLRTFDQDKKFPFHLFDLCIPVVVNMQRSLPPSIPANEPENPLAVLLCTLSLFVEIHRQSFTVNLYLTWSLCSQIDF